MVHIPAGEFIMGSDDVASGGTGDKFTRFTHKPLFVDEHPQRKVFLPAFYLDKYEVTNADYKKFVDEIKLETFPEHWIKGTFPPGKANHPVIYTNWYDAIFYCSSIGKRLPTEKEWEKGARGTEGRKFTWGNEFDEDKGNFGLKRRDTAAVGSFPDDLSPFGTYDTAGNVKEWTSDWYQAYPGSDYQNADFGKKFRVVRGYSYIKFGHYFSKYFVYTTHRFKADPRYATADVGFRCALSTEADLIKK